MPTWLSKLLLGCSTGEGEWLLFFSKAAMHSKDTDTLLAEGTARGRGRSSGQWRRGQKAEGQRSAVGSLIFRDRAALLPNHKMKRDEKRSKKIL